VRTCNKYFDVQQPWATVSSEPHRCKTAIYCCVQAIARLCSLCAPFLPFSSEKIRKILNGSGNVWAPIKVAAGQAIGLSEPPFRRIDRKAVDEEVARLGKE
jgi:methionyl-tRNA synthetase